ncbi:hypothetical protein TAM4_1858 [Thermococcus sp. AM4]|nr:hypothetical protein TAM4_1858 [Thermococcus sp. AM4]
MYLNSEAKAKVEESINIRATSGASHLMGTPQIFYNFLAKILFLD